MSGDSNRRVISTTCTRHGGTPGFTNLVVRKRAGEIELDPHVDGSCVLKLNETAATQLFDVLEEWLGRP
ncbi:MAG: hypothetical protein ACRDS9_21610 [Pseudonocardiaceae bacterium]